MDSAAHSDLRRIPRLLCGIGLLIAVAFMLCWLLGGEGDFRRNFISHSLKFNTSLCFALSTAAAIALSFGNIRFYSRRSVFTFAAALAVLFFGGTALVQYLGGIDMGIDQLFVRDTYPGAAMAFPGRMSPITSVGVTLLGMALVLVHSSRPAAIFFQQLISLLLTFMALFALVGYLLGVSELYQVGSLPKVSYYTAGYMLSLGIGILCLRSDRGFMAMISSRSAGGIAVRRLLPMAIIIPPVVGYLSLRGQERGFYSLAQGTSLSVIAYILLFSFFIYRSGKSLNRIYAEKSEAEKNFLEELEQHTQQLEKAIRTRDEFLSIASHELKTPLTSLKLQVQMQKRLLAKQSPSGEKTDEKIRGFFEIAERQVTRLSRLIEDMLDIGRIESGRFRLNLEEFNLAELVREVAEQMQGEISIAGSALVMNVPAEVKVRADKVRLAQVLMNLLSNSCKYGSGKQIEVSLTEEAAEGRVFLSVMDQGSGIAMPDQERIFERFERAVPGTHISGLGLGLYIVRKIMEQHQGKISVESKLGEGAKFTIELPKETQPSPNLAEPLQAKLDS